jgi:predicted transcriptional regulator
MKYNKENETMLFKKESEIDRLARKKKEIMLKREKLQRDMRERNSTRENKIQALENASQTDYEETQKKVVKLNRKLDKLVRDMNSEQIYVNEVADTERSEYLKDKKDETEKKKLKGVNNEQYINRG